MTVVVMPGTNWPAMRKPIATGMPRKATAAKKNPIMVAICSGTGPATLFQILFEPPPDLARLRPNLPRALVDIVNRALKKSRDDRFPTRQVLVELQRAHCFGQLGLAVREQTGVGAVAESGHLLARAKSEWVYVALADGRPSRIPPDIRARFPVGDKPLLFWYWASAALVCGPTTPSTCPL